MHETFRAVRSVVPGDVVLLSNLIDRWREDFILASSVMILKPLYSATDLLEVGKQVLPVPALVSESLPAIVVRLRTAIKDHAVQFCGSANDLSLVNRHSATT